MLFIICIIPFLCAIFLLIFFKKNVVWWEYGLVIIPSLFITWGLYEMFSYFNQFDIEYQGYYVTKATYYEPWNERKSRVVTYTTGTGKHRVTHHRTVYYTEYHPEKFEFILNDESSISCCKEQFEEVRNYLNVNGVFRDMNRHYYTQDGDAYDYYWNNDSTKMYSITKECNYRNPTKNSSSLFAHHISENKAKELELFDYPEIKDNKQSVILGGNVNKEHEDAINYLNSKYGKEKHIRIYVLFFKDKPASIAEYQREYWEGGNKNELVICIGYDTKNKVISWCHPFSWCDEPVLEAATKQYFLSNNKVNLIGYKNFIEPYIRDKWQMNDFKKFNYISHDISTGQSIFVLICVLLYCIGMSYFVVINEYKY